MELLLIRHAESYANVERVFSNTGWKHGLTPQGFIQAKMAAEALPRFFGKPCRIYSSPLRRAVETAQVIAGRNRVESRELAGFGEISVGDLEGRSDPESWRLHNEIWRKWFSLGDQDARLPGGESMKEAVGRFCFALERLSEEEEGQRFAVVSHGGMLTALLMGKMYEVPDFLIRRGFLSNCDMLRVDFKGGVMLYRGFKAVARKRSSGGFASSGH